MGHVSQPHMDVDSSCLVYSAVQPLDVMDLGPAFPEFPFLDVIDLITLRGGLAFPALLPENSDGPSNNITDTIVCFSVAFLLRKTGSQNLAEIFLFLAFRELIG